MVKLDGCWCRFSQFDSCESFFPFLVHVHEFISFSQRIVPALWGGMGGVSEYGDRNAVTSEGEWDGGGSRGDVEMK